jgi:death on curing protein
VTRYVTLSDALRIVERGGWAVRDLGMLDSVVQRPRAHLYEVELYDGLHLKAASMLDTANRLHPLVDGNKRLSLVLTDVFYALNGLRLESGQDEMVDLVLTIAGDHLPLPSIAEWLSAHVRAL